MIDGLIQLITTLPLNRIRKRQGLPPVGREGFTSNRLNLVPVSPAVFPANPFWDHHHQIVGYWFAGAPQEWVPTPNLLSYLENGDPPVLISLGAMSLGDDDALESAKLFVDAIQEVGIRAIIQGWETGIKQLTLPPSVYAPGPLPHSWLLPYCAGIVHHGGYGTTAAGLRAGIPALVIPHIADQFYWGQKIHELGVGPQPIHRTKLDLSGLASSLDQLIRKEEFQTAAFSLGEQIRSENGVKNAVRLIENTFT
jgi:UDP:flavonoid glycosyltransferase YjiC (YdhE family)